MARPREVDVRTARSMRAERQRGDTLKVIAGRWGFSIPTVARYTAKV